MKTLCLFMLISIGISRFCFGWGMIGLVVGASTGNFYALATGITLLTYNQAVLDDKIEQKGGNDGH